MGDLPIRKSHLIGGSALLGDSELKSWCPGSAKGGYPGEVTLASGRESRMVEHRLVEQADYLRKPQLRPCTLLQQSGVWQEEDNHSKPNPFFSIKDNLGVHFHVLR